MSSALQLAEIRQALRTRWLGKSIELREQTQSTMDDVRAAAEQGAEHGHVVIADTQSAGRGARGRDWESPAGKDLYFSFLYCARSNEAPPIPLTLIIGLGLRRALIALNPTSRIEIKWPNDILIEDRKCAGILVEARGTAEASELVVGAGVNVNRQEFSESIRDTATSLREQTGAELDRNQVMAQILNALEIELDNAQVRPASMLVAELNTHLAWRNRVVRVEEHQGRIVGINENGELELATEHGIVTRQSGHVEPI